MRLTLLALGLSLSLTPLAWAQSVSKPRVISAGAGITELLIALEAQNQLVAVDFSSQVDAPATQIAKLGYHRALSPEGVLSRQPDLMIGSEEMGPETALNVVKDAGVQVKVLPNANTPEQLLANVEQLASLLNREAQAQTLKQQLQAQLDSIKSVRAQLTTPPKVLFILMMGDRPPRLGGSETPADRIITLAGGHNAAGFSGYKSVDQETLLAIKPDFILINKPQLGTAEPNPDTAGSNQPDPVITELLKKLPLLAYTPAGQHNRVINLPTAALLGGLGPSALLASEQLAEQLVAAQ